MRFKTTKQGKRQKLNNPKRPLEIQIEGQGKNAKLKVLDHAQNQAQHNLRKDVVPYGAIQYDGNWGGPGWSAGKYQSSVVDWGYPAVSEADNNYKQHDIGTVLAKNDDELNEVDQILIDKEWGKGIKRSAAAAAVKLQQIQRKKKLRGKNSHSYWHEKEFSEWQRKMFMYGRTGKHPDQQKVQSDNISKKSQTAAEEKAAEAANDHPETPPSKKRASSDNSQKVQALRDQANQLKADINTLVQSYMKTSNDSKKRKIKEQIDILQNQLNETNQAIEKYSANQEEEPVQETSTDKNNTSLSNSTDSTHMDTDSNDNDMTAQPEALRANAISLASRANNVHGGETQLSNINHTIYRPFPSTNQVLMPLTIQFNNNQLETGLSISAIDTFTFRLNSIYDSYAGTPTANPNPVPAIDTVASGNTNNHPQMRKYWDTIYRYYSVVACHYKISFRTTTKDSDAQIVIYEHLHGQEQPPTIDSTNVLIPHQFRKFWPNTRYKFLNCYGEAQQAGTPTNAYGPAVPYEFDNKAVFEGTWYPGRIKHSVNEDDLREIWTLFGKTPTNHEKVTFHVQRSDISSDVAIQWKAYIELKYIVQLKDLKAQFDYLMPNETIASITNAYANTTSTEP